VTSNKTIYANTQGRDPDADLELACLPSDFQVFFVKDAMGVANA
jgi:hypothetical protein